MRMKGIGRGFSSESLSVLSRGHPIFLFLFFFLFLSLFLFLQCSSATSPPHHDHHDQDASLEFAANNDKYFEEDHSSQDWPSYGPSYTSPDLTIPCHSPKSCLGSMRNHARAIRSIIASISKNALPHEPPSSEDDSATRFASGSPGQGRPAQHQNEANEDSSSVETSDIHFDTSSSSGATRTKTVTFDTGRRGTASADAKYRRREAQRQHDIVRLTMEKQARAKQLHTIATHLLTKIRPRPLTPAMVALMQNGQAGFNNFNGEQGDEGYYADESGSCQVPMGGEGGGVAGGRGSGGGDGGVAGGQQQQGIMADLYETEVVNLEIVVEPEDMKGKADHAGSSERSASQHSAEDIARFLAEQLNEQSVEGDQWVEGEEEALMREIYIDKLEVVHNIMHRSEKIGRKLSARLARELEEAVLLLKDLFEEEAAIAEGKAAYYMRYPADGTWSGRFLGAAGRTGEDNEEDEDEDAEDEEDVWVLPVSGAKSPSGLASAFGKDWKVFQFDADMLNKALGKAHNVEAAMPDELQDIMTQLQTPGAPEHEVEKLMERLLELWQSGKYKDQIRVVSWSVNEAHNQRNVSSADGEEGDEEGWLEQDDGIQVTGDEEDLDIHVEYVVDEEEDKERSSSTK